MRRLLIKLGMIKFVLSVISAFYFISFQVFPKNIDGFYVNVFNPMPGGAAEYRSANRTAYEDLQNVEAMVAKLNNNAIRTMYDISSSNAQKEYEKFNEMTYSMDGTIAEKLTKGDRKLTSFKVEGFEGNKEYTMRDGNIIYGVEELIRVVFLENGVSKEESIRLKLGYVPLLKTFKIVDMDRNI